jgi:hypothetical protein
MTRGAKNRQAPQLQMHKNSRSLIKEASTKISWVDQETKALKSTDFNLHVGQVQTLVHLITIKMR